MTTKRKPGPTARQSYNLAVRDIDGLLDMIGCHVRTEVRRNRRYVGWGHVGDMDALRGQLLRACEFAHQTDTQTIIDAIRQKGN